MTHKQILISLLTIFATLGLTWTEPAVAGLPPGNAIKDPYEILRNSLPVEQPDIRDIQHTLEETNESLKGKRWPLLSKAISHDQFLLSRSKQKILEDLPKENRQEGERLLSELAENLDNLQNETIEQNKSRFLDERRKSLTKISDLEALLLGDDFPYSIPEEFNDLPRLLGRANVTIKTTKGDLAAVIDGYNAPLTSGAFVDLALKGFYDGLPISRAEDFYILQSGDPKGPEKGYIDPNTKEERHVPLEIRVKGEQETFYNKTFEELGLYQETPILPFSTFGTLGWAHSSQALDDGSSQFFFLLYEAELNPAGRNLVDGRNAAFGYVVEGGEILKKLTVEDEIISIKVVTGENRLESHA